MKKVTLLGSALAGTLLFNTAIAADFHALTAVPTVPAPIQDKELSAIEGGTGCHFQTGGSAGGGITVCDLVVAWPLISVIPAASFTAANGSSLTIGQFLPVIQ